MCKHVHGSFVTTAFIISWMHVSTNFFQIAKFEQNRLQATMKTDDRQIYLLDKPTLQKPPDMCNSPSQRHTGAFPCKVH